MNLRRTFDNMMRIMRNNKDIVIPIFKALDLNSVLSRDLVREASATALSADNNNSRAINIDDTSASAFITRAFTSDGGALTDDNVDSSVAIHGDLA